MSFFFSFFFFYVSVVFFCIWTSSHQDDQTFSPWPLLWMWLCLNSVGLWICSHVHCCRCRQMAASTRWGCGAPGQPSQVHLRSAIAFLGMRVRGTIFSGALISFWGQSWICFHFHCPGKRCLALAHSQPSGLSADLLDWWYHVPSHWFLGG